MKTIGYKVNYGWDGANRIGTIEVPDDYTKEKIDQLVYLKVIADITWEWEEL